MAYQVVPEKGEEVEAQIELHLSKKAQPFYFAISNRALYIPRIKFIAKSDPYYFQRVLLTQVQQVNVKRLPPYALWLLACLMVISGLFTTIWMMEPILGNTPGKHEVSGWPIAVFVGGVIIPFAAKGRFGLEIQFSDGTYRWKPPLVVDRESKRKIAGALQTIVHTCDKVGVRVSDNRSS